jgi:hypothetical protein
MDSFEVLVMLSNPDDFLGWPRAQKLERYERVLHWHDYIRELHGKGQVRCAWGSHQLLSRANFVNSLGLLIAVYKVESWKQFDELFLRDPLRDYSRYVTTPLTQLLEDRQGDLERYERTKELLTTGSDPMRGMVHSVYRSLFTQQPEYVGKAREYFAPKNPSTNLDEREKAGDPLQIMVMGVNPPEAIGLWDDTRKLFHYEKVNWWHDYMSNLVQEGKVSHVWGAHNFFDITGLSGLTKGAGVAIFRAKTLDEFDSLYQNDPIREATLFWTVLLQPLADQRRMDEERLKQARH